MSFTMAMASYGLERNIYITDVGELGLGVRLPSDYLSNAAGAAQDAREAGVRAAISRYSSQDFAAFDAGIERLSTSNPTTAITTMYLGLTDELLVLLPVGSPESLMLQAQHTLGQNVTIGSIQFETSSREDDYAPFSGGA